MSSLNDPVPLPCGLVLPNRLSKAAMAELMARYSEHLPTRDQLSVYNKWGAGGWGSVLTGNVQVDINHLGTPLDPALTLTLTDEDEDYRGKESNPALIETWSRYASAVQQHGVPAIVQIVHPGRQSARPAGRRGLFGNTLAPSAVPVRLGEGWLAGWVSWLAFPPPREMNRADIERVSRKFVDTARVMADAGFAGVELHGAHGYLIDQFLNPKTNLRTDAYGGSPQKRAKFVLDIIAAIREVVPSSFCIGIKLNSADHSSDTFEETMTQIGLLVEAGIDFLEVSGGSYEDPRMMMGKDQPQQQQPQESKSARTAAREAFFLEFAHETRRRHPSLVLMLTGGFRTRAGALSAIRENACDLIGVARPAAVDPSFARLLLDESVEDEKAGLPLNKVATPWYARFLPARSVGAGLESSYYAAQIQRIGKGLKTFVPSL